MKELRYIAMAGDALFILWIAHNAIDEGFRSIRTVEAASLTGLVFLLGLNIVLLWRQR